MFSYCLKCRKITEKPKIEKMKYRRIMLSSSYVVCGSKRPVFNKELKHTVFD